MNPNQIPPQLLAMLLQAQMQQGQGIGQPGAQQMPAMPAAPAPQMQMPHMRPQGMGGMFGGGQPAMPQPGY